ncbi:MAG: hypothetical protein WBZ36_26950 [Candidatus Nitrosopolaris sp.]
MAKAACADCIPASIVILLDKDGSRIPRVENAGKSRLKCCPDMEYASNNSPGPFYFTDKHYLESNGYKCEIDGY